MTLRNAKTRAVLYELDTGERIKLSQADRVIVKFNGATRLAEALGCDPSTIYKWTYPKAKQGTDGIIPGSALRKVMLAARREGIYLTPEDMWPGEL